MDDETKRRSTSAEDKQKEARGEQLFLKLESFIDLDFGRTAVQMGGEKKNKPQPNNKKERDSTGWKTTIGLPLTIHGLQDNLLGGWCLPGCDGGRLHQAPVQQPKHDRQRKGDGGGSKTANDQKITRNKKKGPSRRATLNFCIVGAERRAYKNDTQEQTTLNKKTKQRPKFL